MTKEDSDYFDNLPLIVRGFYISIGVFLLPFWFMWQIVLILLTLCEKNPEAEALKEEIERSYRRRNMSQKWPEYHHDDYDDIYDWGPDTSDNHRCHDGSLDMRYNENQGYSKYND